jgi:outer membrane protein TolC
MREIYLPPFEAAVIEADAYGVMAAYNKVGGVNYPTVSGRLALTHVLDDSDQKVQERNANFKLKQAEIELEQAKRNITDDVKNKIDNVDTSYIVYKSARESRIQSETYFNKMLNNLQKGRLDSATVKNGLDALILSRQSEINALVNYNVSLFQFLVAKNQLWEKFDIDVEEYIPKHK